MYIPSLVILRITLIITLKTVITMLNIGNLPSVVVTSNNNYVFSKISISG